MLSFCHRKDAARGVRRTAEVAAQGSLVCEAISSRHRAHRAARALVGLNNTVDVLLHLGSFVVALRERVHASPLASILQAAS